MTKSALRLNPASLAGTKPEALPPVFSAGLGMRLEQVLPQRQGWPWLAINLALAAHLLVAAILILAVRVHMPKPPPEPIAIDIVSETTPQGAAVAQPVPTPQPQPKPAPAAQPLPVPPAPNASPAPAAPLSDAGELPPPPPPAPPAPQTPAAPQPAAQSSKGAKIKAQKQASVTVAVLHPAQPYADNQAPDYPQSAINAGEQGVVRFKLYIGADGRVQRFELTQSSGFADLDASVRNAALGWRYKPAMRGSVAVPSVVKFHVRFEPH